MIELYVFIFTVLLFFSGVRHYQVINFLSDLHRSIIFRLCRAFSCNRFGSDNIVNFYIAIALSVVVWSILKYSQSGLLLYLVVPLLALVLFDFVFLVYVLPVLRYAIFPVEYFLVTLSRENVFSNAINLSEPILHPLFRLIRIVRSPVERLVFVMPATFGVPVNDRSLRFQNSLRILLGYLWYRSITQSVSHYFVFLLVVVFCISLFYLLVSFLYFKAFLGFELKGNLWLIFFSVVWIIYSVALLRALMGREASEYYGAFLSMVRLEANEFSYMTVYRLRDHERNSVLLGNQHIIDYEAWSGSHMVLLDYVIGFLTMVMPIFIVGLL